MSLETAIAELTAAVRENTAAHTKLAEVAIATRKGSAPDVAEEPKAEKKAAPKAAPKSAPKADPEEPKTEKEAPKKAAPKKAAPPKIAAEVSDDEIKVMARNYMSGDDEDEREAKKANVSAAFNHLGVKKLSEIEEDADRARLAGYIAYWAAGLKVDFEEIDGLVEAAGDDDAGDGDGDDGDDMLD